MQESKRAEFKSLFDEFVVAYPASAEGKRHCERYEEGREEGRRNFNMIVSRVDRGEAVEDDVLLKLLPYTDQPANRKVGAWVHVAPSVTGNLKRWFERNGWANADDWPHIAAAILAFVRRCEAKPAELEAACQEFVGSGFGKGFQTGMLTPILNALRPDDFILINSKSRHTVNYFAETSFRQSLSDYPGVNSAAKHLISEAADVMQHDAAPNIRDADRFDMFSHWLVAVKKYFEHRSEECGYWKIAPGSGAWNWEACRDNGFIAIGWDEFGDVSGMDRETFEQQRDQLVVLHDNWTKSRVDQVWTFAHTIKPGDRVIANRGTTEVLGIGTVTGPYTYAPNEPYGHRLPVQWDDVQKRKVTENGWRRTIVRLSKQKFDTLCKLPSDDAPEDPMCPFSPKSFQLLAGLYADPTKKQYQANKEQIQQYVEEPVKRLFRRVAKLLPPVMTEALETEKGLFARILKNDWGQGGAWPHYWAAFYPKGGKRQTDAQLFVTIERHSFRYGFSIGHEGADQALRFVNNWQQTEANIPELLRDSLDTPELNFRSPGGEAMSWKDWSGLPVTAAPDVYAELTKDAVVRIPEEALAQQIGDLFSRLFPLVLLATSDRPVQAIGDYFDLISGDDKDENPEYPLEECEADTSLDIALLQRWVRAIERKKQAIVYGPPGTGKTFVAEHLARHLIGGGDGFMELVQFHPAYAYEDFVQGIRPTTQLEGGLKYDMVPGRFLEFCQKAKACTGNCVLIIDEINRANLSRVFGELMYLLEYRDHSIPLAGGGRLRIPENVRIIGTMNTADRSIALVDHALRRRFAFLALRPNYDVLERFHEETGFPVASLIETLKQLNVQINDPHYEVGISFFLLPNLEKQIEDVWRMEIEPYLEEYFFDQQGKVDQFRWGMVAAQIVP